MKDESFTVHFAEDGHGFAPAEHGSVVGNVFNPPTIDGHG